MTPTPSPTQDGSLLPFGQSALSPSPKVGEAAAVPGAPVKQQLVFAVLQRCSGGGTKHRMCHQAFPPDPVRKVGSAVL